MIKRFLQGLAFGVAIFSSGCVSLLPETAPPKPRYHIEAVGGDALSGDRVNWSLVVEDPRTTRVFDSVKVAVSPAPGKIEYFAGAEWADRAPRLFQTAVVQSFEDTGRILSIGDRAAVPIGDIILQTDIRKLQVNVAGGAETPLIVIYARLTDGKGTVYAAQQFRAERGARAGDPDSVMAAFDEAFTAVISDLVAWTFLEGEAVVANERAGS